jgi:CRP/FNR family transcriptional regulator, cyclic AMP receptor protein
MPSIQPTLWAEPTIKPPASTFEPDNFLATARCGQTSEYRKDQEIFAQGEVADSVFYIQKGKIKITVVSEHGKEAVVGVLEAGQFFGEGCLYGPPLRTSTMNALERSEITAITRAVMISTLRSEPKFSAFFIEHLLNRNSRIEEDVIDQLFNSSEKRLARLLLLLANYGKEGRPPIVPVTFSQETLAEMIGTTRSRVSFFMNKFRRLGFISYFQGEIEVRHSLLDAVLHDKPEISTEH